LISQALERGSSTIFPYYHGAAPRASRPSSACRRQCFSLAPCRRCPSANRDQSMRSDKKAESARSSASHAALSHHTTSLVFNARPCIRGCASFLLQPSRPRAAGRLPAAYRGRWSMACLAEHAERGPHGPLWSKTFALPTALEVICACWACIRRALSPSRYSLAILGALNRSPPAPATGRRHAAVARVLGYLTIVSDRRKAAGGRIATCAGQL